MKYTLSLHARDAISFRDISEEWINAVLEEPSGVEHISNSEVHYFKTIADNENRCLKVIVNPEKRVVITAFFDRKMRKRGCK